MANFPKEKSSWPWIDRPELSKLSELSAFTGSRKIIPILLRILATMQGPAKRSITFMDHSHILGSGVRTPSAFQRGDDCEIYLAYSGVLRKCKIAAVLFKAEGISYDVDVPYSPYDVDDPEKLSYRRWHSVPGGLVDLPGTHKPNGVEFALVLETMRKLRSSLTKRTTYTADEIDVYVTDLEVYLGMTAR